MIKKMGLNGITYALNWLPIDRNSKKPIYIDQFTDDQLSLYTDTFYESLKKVIV